jgi:hypothetical protein
VTARAAVLLASLAALTGCLPAWVNPTRADAATMTFIPPASGDVVVGAFADGKECRTRMNVGGFGNLRQKTEIRIPPDAEFATVALFSSGNLRCSVAMSFLPKPRESYVTIVDWTGAKCRMGIGRMDGKKFIPEPTARPRKWSEPTWSNSQAQCD